MLTFQTMVSRSAGLVLAPAERQELLRDSVRAVQEQGSTGKDSFCVLEYKNLKVVVEYGDRVVKVMTENEYLQLYPMLTTTEGMSILVPTIQDGKAIDPILVRGPLQEMMGGNRLRA